MSIQSNINQALGVGAVLATQTPAYQAQVQKKIKQQEITAQQGKVETAGKANVIATREALAKDSSQESKNIAAEMAQEYARQTKELYKMNPTEKNLRRVDVTQGISNIMTGIANKKYRVIPYDMQRAQQAVAQAKQAQAAKAAQKSIIINANKWGVMDGKE